MLNHMCTVNNFLYSVSCFINYAFKHNVEKEKIVVIFSLSRIPKKFRYSYLINFSSYLVELSISNGYTDCHKKLKIASSEGPKISKKN